MPLSQLIMPSTIRQGIRGGLVYHLAVVVAFVAGKGEFYSNPYLDGSSSGRAYNFNFIGR
jgi:hypothetical protein